MNNSFRFRSNSDRNRNMNRSRERPRRSEGGGGSGMPRGGFLNNSFPVGRRGRDSRPSPPRRHRSREPHRFESRDKNIYQPQDQRELHFSPPHQHFEEDYRRRSPERVPFFEPPEREERWIHQEEEIRPPWKEEASNHPEESQFHRNQEHWSEYEQNPNQGIQYTNDDMIMSPIPQEQRSSRHYDSQDLSSFLNDEGHPMIPIFDGENPELPARQFIKILEDVAAKENWTPEDKKIQMVAKMRGPAREWIFKDEKLNENWGRIKRSLFMTFLSEMDHYSCLHRMFNRTKALGESYSNYFTYKMILLKNCQLSGRKAVSCLIGGLQDEALKIECLDKNFPTPDILYSYLMEREHTRPVRNISPPIQEKEIILNIPINKECFYCRETGHLVSQCPNKAKQKQDRNFIDVRINGINFRAFNDKKCEVVTIRQDQAGVAKLLYNREKKIIRGYKGALINSIGDITVLLRVDNISLNIPVFVVPNTSQQAPVVVGNSLREHADVSYSEDSNEIHFNHRMFAPLESSSFHMNEMIVQKMSSSSSGSSMQMSKTISSNNPKRRW